MDKITNQELVDFYNEMLDEQHDGEINICGMKYAPSYALKEVDPIAYELGMHDFADSLMADGAEVEGY